MALVSKIQINNILRIGELDEFGKPELDFRCKKCGNIYRDLYKHSKVCNKNQNRVKFLQSRGLAPTNANMYRGNIIL